MLEILTAAYVEKLKQRQKLVAPDSATADRFGWSVSVSKDGVYCVIGAYNKNSGKGAVYVYKKQTDGNYLQFQKLTASDGAIGDYFGWSVSTNSDGSIIVVSAHLDDDKGVNSGSVYVFTRGTSTYTQSQKLTASDGATVDWFGYSVAISADGSVIIVGAPLDDDKGADSGSVYVFTKGTTSYTQTLKITASNGAAADQFGSSVAVTSSGSIIVVGAHLDDPSGTDSGSIYVFSKGSGFSYTQRQNLVPADSESGDKFGIALAISGDASTILASSVFDDDGDTDAGAVYVYSRVGDTGYTYTLSQKLLAKLPASNDKFGVSLAINYDASTIAIGACLRDEAVVDSGSVFVFKKKADGLYYQLQNLTVTDAEAYDNLGYSVAISDTNIVSGAYIRGSFTGATYVFG